MNRKSFLILVYNIVLLLERYIMSSDAYEGLSNESLYLSPSIGPNLARKRRT